MPIAAVLIGLAGSGLMAGISAATTPDVGTAVLDDGAGQRADAATLPARRAIQSAAMQGKPISVKTGRQVEAPKTFNVQYKAPGSRGENWQTFTGTQAEIDAAKARGGALDGMVVGDQRWDGKTNLVDETLSADFTGAGDADVQGAVAKQMAQNYLDLSKKYGTDFITESKKQLEEADPEGTAARKQLWTMIEKQAAEKPERPVAEMLDRQIGEEVASGNRMSASAAKTLDTGTSAANSARGDILQRSILQKQLESGTAGQARADAARQKGMGWLTSGATPEDTSYRREQQNLANMSSFAQGTTPTAQFASLSGAQQGATPMVTGNALPNVNNNANQASNAFNLGSWSAQGNAAMGQANAWTSGLSSVLQGAGTIVAATK